MVTDRSASMHHPPVPLALLPQKLQLSMRAQATQVTKALR
jgi:hypothetical protein